MLLISQVYVPDPAAVGQYFHDTCAEMVRRGHRVVVFASAQGYANPAERFPRREILDGVEIRRFGLSSFGKKNFISRISGQLLFLLQCVVHSIGLRGLDGILVSTSPPMASAVGLFASFLHRVPLVFWAMDLNPDQAVAMGVVKENSILVRMFNVLNRRVLDRAAAVVTLDRYMAERVLKKADVADKLHVFPPWPLEGHLETVMHENNPFREAHGLTGKIVFMYSGNHTNWTPLRTVLDAALQLRDDPRFKFVFIGGGNGKPEVDDTIAKHKPGNMLSLPYQSLANIKYSLSAADVHIVSLGNTEVGLRHPCKIYGAMALSRPVLFLGPARCSVGDLMEAHQLGWHIEHGDTAGAVATIEKIGGMAREDLQVIGARARAVIDNELSESALCGRMCDIIQAAMQTAKLKR